MSDKIQQPSFIEAIDTAALNAESETQPTATTERWTPAQRLAIDRRARMLIVSAAAGSGKTSVLTERVLELVHPSAETADTEPVGLDRMLIITFTEKAARQMRERIERRLLDALDAQPEARPLRAALDALPSAWITTIDSFCHRVVSEHFHRVGTLPNIRIPDGTQLHELEQEAIRNALEAEGKDALDPAQLDQLLACYGGRADQLSEEIISLLRFLDSIEGSESWLATQLERARITAQATSLAELPLAETIRESFAWTTRGLIEAFARVIELGRAQGGDPERVRHWQKLHGEMQALLDAGTGPLAPEAWQQWIETENAGQVLGRMELKSQSGKAFYDDKTLLEGAIKPFAFQFKDWLETWFALSPGTLLTGERLAAEQLASLLALTRCVLEELGKLKRRSGWTSFADLEHLTYKILCDPTAEGGTVGPSEVAMQLRRRFRHVMIDEYQDTSPLQDAIVRLVVGSDDQTSQAHSDLFIVGDLKQSIYGFRHAAPDLFQAKIDAALALEPAMAVTPETNRTPDATQPEATQPEAIHLDQNFRSREDLLAFINACFERLIDREVGEMDYDDNASLKPWRKASPDAPIAIEAHWITREFEDDDDTATEHAEPADEGDDAENNSETEDPPRGIEAQAVYVAQRIAEMTGGDNPIMIDDPKAEPDGRRPARPNDCAILLRGISYERDQWIAALDRFGLRARTPGVSPLFTAPELVDLLAALRVADNPMQDVPLASLMRSPMFGFSEDELLAIRGCERGDFHHAVWVAARRQEPSGNVESVTLAPELAAKLQAFMTTLGHWRVAARQLPPVQLLALILESTRYEAWLMGKPDGQARLERLDHLRGLLASLTQAGGGADPLSTFIERIESIREGKGELEDLPEPVAEDTSAVALLTIHKSKGLEFPVVVLPRLERKMRKPKPGDTLIDRTRGIARMGIDLANGLRYPTLSRLALVQARELRERAEELRLLYVGMTRAQDRLLLVGQFETPEKKIENWAHKATHKAGALERLRASSPAELLGPIIESLRTQSLTRHMEITVGGELPPTLPTPEDEPIRRALAFEPDSHVADWAAARAYLAEQLKATGEPLPEAGAPVRFLPACDPLAALTRLPTKLTVTQLIREQPRASETDEEKFWREQERFIEEEMRRANGITRRHEQILREPDWLTERTGRPGGALRGSLTHEFLARLDLRGGLDVDGLREQAEHWLTESPPAVARGFEPRQILSALDFEALAWFFESDPGQALTAEPGRALRELPITYRMGLGDLDGELGRSHPGERVLVQGIIDLVLDYGDSAMVIDYKTDYLPDQAAFDERLEHYSAQIGTYARALKSAWGLDAVQTCLVFLGPRRLVFG